MLDLQFLSSQEKLVWGDAQTYLVDCRWWDLWHTKLSAEYMDQLVREEQAEDDRDILMPSILLHDIGWSAAGEDKNRSWGDANMRVLHMRVGAELAKPILEKAEYAESEIETIVGLIATHDNGYLGVDPKSNLEEFVRDADASFILTELSFWKDYHVATEMKGAMIKPQSFLEKQVEKYNVRYTKTAQHILTEQIAARKAEIVDTSLTPLERYYDLQKQAQQLQEYVEQ